MTQSPGEAAAWDRYWAHGNLHSFSQVTAGNYSGPIGAFWARQFDRVGDRACVVDIATGNGAVALLALDAADRAGRAPVIHGTDIAAIEPARQLTDPALRERAARIHFHPRTPAEGLPFETGSVDLACSQFGLEYSDLQRSLPELGRIVIEGGRVALILHHARSGAVQAARSEAAQAAFVLDDARLYARARQLLRALADMGNRWRPPGAKLPAKAAKKRDALDKAVARIRASADDTPDPTVMRGALNYVDEVMAMTERIGPARALDWLEEARQRIAAMRERLQAMQHAALDEAGMERFGECLTAAGFQPPAIDTLVEPNGPLLGWTAEAVHR